MNIVMQTAEARSSTSKDRVWRVTRAVISLGLIAALAYSVGTKEILAHFSAATLPFIAIATVILSISVLVVTPRWSLILDLLGYRISWKALFESVLLGFFLNQVLPTAVGGDALRAWRAKQLGAAWEASIHSVLLDRATGVLISFLGAAALLPFAGYHQGGRIFEWSVGAIAVCAIFGLAALWALARWRTARHPMLAGLNQVAVGFGESLWTFVRRPSTSMTVFALAALNQTLSVVAILVVARGLNISLPALDIALITFIATLAATIPISFAGWGIREGILVYLFGLYGVSSDAAFAASVLFGLALTLSASPGALMLLRRQRLSPPATREARDASLGGPARTVEKPNDQYNAATPDSAAVRVGLRMRHRMFDEFMRRLDPRPTDTALDVGVTSDQTYAVSNYFEALYPFKTQITAVGLGDASFLEELYPGLTYVQGNAISMPFPDGSFDLVHSSAVVEHVGSLERQVQMIRECVRVAKRGICVTTPNRWFPIEFHTQLPLVHWLPPSTRRAAMRLLGYGFFAEENNLNLLSAGRLRQAVAGINGWRFEVITAKLLGWPSNLLLFGYRDAP